MRRIYLFLDSGALFAGVASATGAARALLLLAEANQIQVTVSEQVVGETERAVAGKLPQALGYYREALLSTGLRVVHDPSAKDVEACHVFGDIISHPAGVPLVVAAMRCGADYLATFSRRHFIDDRGATAKSGIPIGTPGDALEWVCKHLAEQAGRPQRAPIFGWLRPPEQRLTETSHHLIMERSILSRSRRQSPATASRTWRPGSC